MTSEDALLLFGAALFIYREWFWSHQTQKLLDKFMSRNYAEYAQVNHPSQPVNRIQVPASPLEDLNALDAVHTL